ncbi:predicted protein [Botrytis cinerea T4]|uniref:Uncharacterized protein n=1 Tax=Botryotinia fuckeliana (strain T4) TaxID=999810 RepID=G2Y7Y9_BOTF4|nr:predicted protein [Botrytis cinerea T4]
MSEAPQADPSTGGFNTFSFCGCLELPEPARNADKNAALKIRDKPKLQDSTPVQKLLFLRLSAGVLVTLLGNANKIFQDILSLAGEEGPRYRYCSKERWWVAISKPTQSNNEFRFHSGNLTNRTYVWKIVERGFELQYNCSTPTALAAAPCSKTFISSLADSCLASYFASRLVIFRTPIALLISF